MLNFIEDNSIYIVPNTIKNDIIKNIRLTNKSVNIKFFTLDEFISNLTFTYDEKTIYKIMKLENVNYNIAKLYLNNMCYIFDECGIDKLDKLYRLKVKIDNNLIKNDLFKLLIKNKKIYIYGYDYITKFQKYFLNSVDNITFINKNYKLYEHNVYKFNTLENEVIFIAERISELIHTGIDINKIYLSNLDSNYYTNIKKIFNMYNIPVNLKEKHSLYNTVIGKYFIDNLCNDIDSLMDDINNKFDMNNKLNKSIYNKLIDVINKFYFTNDYISVKKNILNVLKNTYLDNKSYINAVNEIDIVNNIINDDEYVFLLGFNLNSIP